MPRKRLGAVLAVGLALSLLMGMTTMAWSMGSRDKANVPRISKEEVKNMLGTSDLIVIDVRTSSLYKSSKLKIQGALREDAEQIKSWERKYAKDKTIVLYCSWPNEETSAWVAQELMKSGFKKVYALKGGWHDWVEAKFPTEEK
jgi:rhodanese-related sulfurtransferase